MLCTAHPLGGRQTDCPRLLLGRRGPEYSDRFRNGVSGRVHFRAQRCAVRRPNVQPPEECKASEDRLSETFLLCCHIHVLLHYTYMRAAWLAGDTFMRRGKQSTRAPCIIRASCESSQSWPSDAQPLPRSGHSLRLHCRSRCPSRWPRYPARSTGFSPASSSHHGQDVWSERPA